MNKTQAKKDIKKYGVYDAINDLQGYTGADFENLKEIIFRVLDNIPSETMQKAINKATR